DFTTIDPHLGTNDDMALLISSAHERGMKVYFDILVNHTADVLTYAGGDYSYIPEVERPWLDATGTPFDDNAVANTPEFPELNLASFPKEPVFADEADRTAKTPAWLNDPTMYHNRGDTTWEGESATYGDFSGLDDLFTERPEVLDGMSEIYEAWIAMGVDGFRIDTVKHVNLEFWRAFVPRMQEAARKHGNDDFFMFGEVFDADPTVLSGYTTTGRLPATLDFGFQGAIRAVAAGQSPTALANLWASDDLYTDGDSSAYSLPTFTGNHDMGRLAMMLAQQGFSGDDLVRRVTLAHDLMYSTRGQPVIYYGDEQGFAGSGGDKDARQDMFATRVAQYASEPLADGTPLGSTDHFGTGGEIYHRIAISAAMQQLIPALATGAQVVRQADAEAGILALSRIDRSSGTEVLVVANTATEVKSASFSTWSPEVTYWRVDDLAGGPAQVPTDVDGHVSLDVPPLSVLVLHPSGSMAIAASPADVDLTAPHEGARANGMIEISAAMPADRFAMVTFWWRPTGGEWASLGTDDTPTARDDGRAGYRVVVDSTSLPDGSLIEVRVVAKDSGGRVSVDGGSFLVGQAG
ncbi:MAG TPA: alpha-amylase family glycosyl hydrolase, partial [Propionibacteriaceae bacterium]|nr:alpha-amylase family glycosyl hydrolase [Propionibacteriaceae bacterium]